MDAFDVVVIGTGSAGGPLASELARAGWSVLGVEQELVGGECAYLACIPSKALLLAARRHRARVGQRGSERPDLEAWAAAIGVRDRAAHHRDDGAELHGLEKAGVTIRRGHASVAGAGRVRIDGAAGSVDVGWRRALVLATGARAVLPPIEGLADVPTWTSPQALSSAELPERLVIVGGGAIGCELAQVYATFGSRVTLIEATPTLLPRETGWVGEQLAGVLEAVGVDVRTGTQVESVDALERADGGAAARVHTGSGEPVECDRILVAIGKKPDTGALGLATLGIEANDGGALDVDARMRALAGGHPLPDVFAIGDLTALSPYTHSANYHARLVAAQLLGHGRDADHTGIPRVAYTDPPVLCAGETPDAARERGVRVLTARTDMTGTSRSALERLVDTDDHRPASLELVADADSHVLIGVSAIGPEADSWAAELALAVRSRLTVEALADHPHAFPSWTEGIHGPAQDLAEHLLADAG